MPPKTRYISVMNLHGPTDSSYDALPNMDAAAESHRLSRTYKRMQRGLVVVGDVLYSTGGAFGPRRQADFQLVVIHTGHLTLTLDDETIDVPEGHGILLSPGHNEYFRFAPNRETRHSWIAARPALMAQRLSTDLRKCRGPLPFLGRMATLLDMVRHETQPADEDALADAAIECLGVTILCEFASAVRNRRMPRQPGETALWRMDRFLSEACRRPLTLHDIARAAGVSRQHLLKLCRMANRQSPMEELYARRLELASDLLLHTGFSIAEVADQTGFLNQFHFSRRFKQKTGKSPSKWRGQLWK